MNRFFVDRLKSFSLGSPEMVEKWKRFIFEMENENNTVVAFVFPKKYENELIEEIEKLINNKVT